jgi:hypothetical protein
VQQAHDRTLRGVTPTQPPDLCESTLVVQWLAIEHDVTVTVSDQIPDAPCESCGERPARARVHGDPVDDSTSTAVVDCCPWCVGVVTDLARRELRDGSRVGVRLEVAA